MDAQHRPGGGMRPVLWFVLALTAARLLYLAFLCPYTLIEDEAHYWEWSRHLGLSYYSKGPGVAWVIAASTALLGDTELGVRLFAPFFSAVATLALAGLARAMHRDPRLPLLTAACFQLIPAYQFTSLIFTIDMPYVACWAAAALAGWYAIEHRRGRAWVALGAAMGIGFLFKYTILLLAPGLLIYAALRRRSNDHPRSIPVLGPLLALAVFALALTPILIWNQQHGWPTIRHLLGHLGMTGGDMPVSPAAPGPRYTPAWTLEYIGAQFGLVGPMLIVMIMSAVRAVRDRRGDDAYAFLCAAPIILFYLAISFIAEGEGNWAIAGYSTLTIPAARLGLDAFDRHRAAGPARRRPAHSMWRFAAAWGVCTGLLMLRIDWLTALPVLGPRIPTGRLMHADTRAREMAARADELAHRTGQVPFFMAQHYGRASQMAFYLPGRPTVYCTSKLMGGRATQYDMWPFTDLTDPATHAQLQARPAIMSGGQPYQWEICFQEVRSLGSLSSESKRGRLTFEGLGYRGFPEFPPRAGGPSP
ncbi:MAG: glycosyltransferase family 39 protein [Phycisphaerales bacterium]|nr:glycosyltransferase family 39 protein [Phycisphaerales bacterium]